MSTPIGIARHAESSVELVFFSFGATTKNASSFYVQIVKNVIQMKKRKN